MRTVTRYQQIINYYQELIESGQLSEGDQMPTEEAIGTLFGVSRITVRQALDGWPSIRADLQVQGKGSFCGFRKNRHAADYLKGFSDEMRMLGRTPSTVLVEKALVTSDRSRGKSAADRADAKVYLFVRLRCADGIPWR